METKLQTRAEIIDNFLHEKKMSTKDLARYLELHHNFCCYQDTHIDQ